MKPKHKRFGKKAQQEWMNYADELEKSIIRGDFAEIALRRAEKKIKFLELELEKYKNYPLGGWEDLPKLQDL